MSLDRVRGVGLAPAQDLQPVQALLEDRSRASASAQGQDSAVEATSGSPRPAPSFISAASARRTRVAAGGSLPRRSASQSWISPDIRSA